MNYLKKIKSLGFKKVDNIAVFEYSWVTDRMQGLYLGRLDKVVLDKPGKTFREMWGYVKYPKVSSIGDVDKIQTYYLKISDDVSLYLLLVRSDYTVVIEDNSIPDETYAMAKHQFKKNVYIPLSDSLDEKFWKKILASLEKGIQREILLKEIMKL